MAAPFAVVVDELFDVSGLVERSQKKMLEHGVVQHGDSGPRQRPLVDGAMQGVVAEVVEAHIGVARIHFHFAQAAQRAEQRGGVIRDARALRRKRRIESGFHSYLRGPNSAVPTRMWVAPSSMATSRSVYYTH